MADLLPAFQRLTMTTPRIWAGRVAFPLLPSGTLVARRPGPSVPHVPEERESRIRAVIETFQRELLARCFDPIFSEAPRLAEYEGLLRGLQELREPSTPFRRTLVRLLGRGRTLTLNGRSYRLSKVAEKRLSATAPPAEVARALLVEAWGGDSQALKENVARWRQERVIAQAWATWSDWVQAYPERLREVASLLEPLPMWGSRQPVS